MNQFSRGVAKLEQLSIMPASQLLTASDCSSSGTGLSCTANERRPKLARKLG